MFYIGIATFIGVISILAIEVYQLDIFKKSSIRNNNSVFLDTSVLIDSRIIEIARAGFVPGKMVIPRSVLGELQYMADNADNEKRAKARKGLDVARELQNLDGVTVEILQDKNNKPVVVDDRLIVLAKEYDGMLCTLDFNLNKVAQVEGVRVLNINELAVNLRAYYRVGDTFDVELAQKGQDKTQAVGYIEDGTMVVVEKSSTYIGKVVKVEVVRNLRTDSGNMIFAKRVVEESKPRFIKKPKFTNRTKKTTNSRNNKRTSKPSKEDELVRLANK